MRPKDIVSARVDAFNRADAEALAAFYEDNIEGRDAIRVMFAEWVCENRDGLHHREPLRGWGVGDFGEWRDPMGLRGCGFFRVVNSEIVFQRGYWDKLSFLKLHDLPGLKVPA